MTCPWTPYDYQSEALDVILKEVQSGLTRGGIMLPTGTGKTVIEILSIDKLQRYPAAVVVPFDTLVDNTLAALRLMYEEEDIGVVKAELNQWDRKIVVISIQTITREKRRELLAKRFKYVVADEMHLMLAAKFGPALLDIVAEDGLLLGFSATVGREDRVALSKVFGKLIFYRSLPQMIDEGYLCNLIGIKIDAQIDLSSLPFGDDYRDSDLEQILNTEECLELLYQGWKQHASDRVTIAFTPTVKMAQDCAAFWKAKGELADWVSGAGEHLSEKEMDQKIARFVGGEIQVIFNASKLGTGFDHRPIGCCYLIRPTRSQTLYIQNCGRATRVCNDTLYTEMTRPIKDRVLPTKRDSIILDASGASDLGLVQFPDLFDMDESEAKPLKERAATGEVISYQGDIVEKTPVKASGLHTERVDLFNSSKYSWVSTKIGWVLSLAKVGEVFLGRRGGHYIVEAIVNGAREVLQEHPISLEWAMSIGEQWAQKRLKEEGSRTLGKKAAPWRKGELSEKQFYLLRRFKRYEILAWTDYMTYLQQAPEVLTKGQAADIITKIFAEKK